MGRKRDHFSGATLDAMRRGLDPRMCGSYFCDPTTFAMVLQTCANLRTAAYEGLPAPVAPSPPPLSTVAPSGNSTAAGNRPAPAAAPVATPPVLPSKTIPFQQQPGNAVVTSTTFKVAAVLAAIAAPSFPLSSKPIQTSSRLSNKSFTNHPILFQLSLNPQQIKERKKDKFLVGLKRKYISCKVHKEITGGAAAHYDLRFLQKEIQ